jgi:hypothetical protein
LFFAEKCSNDPALRSEVEAMLAGHDHAGEFGEAPLVACTLGTDSNSSVGATGLAPGFATRTV